MWRANRWAGLSGACGRPGPRFWRCPPMCPKLIRSTGLPNRRGRHSVASMSSATTPGSARRKARRSAKRPVRIGAGWGGRTCGASLLEQEEGHVVNTASMAGLNTSAPGSMGVYSVSKHAVVALSESLQVSLQIRDAHVGVSVLCPAWVRTNISESKRNRPAESPDTEPERTPQATAAIEYVKQLVAAGSSPDDMAASVVDAIHKQRFYVLPHREALPGVRQRMEDILENRSPVLGPPWAPWRR